MAAAMVFFVARKAGPASMVTGVLPLIMLAGICAQKAIISRPRGKLNGVVLTLPSAYQSRGCRNWFVQKVVCVKAGLSKSWFVQKQVCARLWKLNRKESNG